MERITFKRGNRKGFSLMLVLLFVIVMAVIGALALEFIGIGTKHTVQSFIDLRSKLMTRAGTEFAIMAIEAHDFSQSCLKQVNLDDPGFDINITFHYFMTDCGVCGDNFCTPIETNETNGTVLIYTQVVPKIPDLFRVRTFRVTLQNP
ncbi:MAG: hypothetical protein ABGW77_06575 [Campylobacterales bacterium]